MSEKNRDNKNRWRNVTIAFRMSPEENEELDLRVKLCGYQTRQEYIIESVLHQKVTAVGNPLMLVQFRKQLRGIEEELKRLTTLEDADEELQANSAYSRGLSCASRYRYAISSGVSRKIVELHFSQLIVRGELVYVSLMALTITESVSGSYIPNR